MCGIAGFFGPPDPDLLERMMQAIRHRGPDDSGRYEIPEMSIGMRRLSIIDIDGGHQPMSNEDGTIQLVYNGELYNYRELRAELLGLGHRFTTHSDTEVIVHAYEEWGPECFGRFNGMWAVAIADLRTSELVLSRDHFGIKPLYYAQAGDRLLFASEIKALVQDPSLERIPDDQMVYEYLMHGLHDHRRETFFQGVCHLPAAHYAVIGKSGRREAAYWQPKLSQDGELSPKEFHELFRRSVARRLIADVPVGAALSGGLDSSTIVTLMADLLRDDFPDAESMRGQVKTFSAVFDGDPIDERAYIEEAIRSSGADTVYTHPDSKTFTQELQDLVYYLDEPFVSTGPYAQWCVMRTAREHVKVVLDGQGGDELLAGYVPYQLVYLRQLFAQRRLGELVRESWLARDVLWPTIRRNLRSRRRHLPIRPLLRETFLASAKRPEDTRSSSDLKGRLLDDLRTYSLPALLRYEDRNSMAHSIESRVPYLDQEMVEAVLRLPDRAIVSGGWSRAILRQSMAGLLPDRIRLRRWKVGFTTPESRWLFARRAVFQGLFRSPLFQSRPYWRGERVAAAFRDAAEGRVEASMFFWRAINVELWLRIYIDGDAPGPDGRIPPFTQRGDELFARRVGPQAEALLGEFTPNAGRHLFAASGGRAYLRAPIRTPLVKAHDHLGEILRAALGERLRPGDTIAVSEKIVAISQGRSFPIAEVHPRPLARWLTRFVRKTSHGIGLGIPQTMELAVREVGAPRILLAAAVAAVARLFGRRGVFYDILGPTAAAIDGPTSGTIPPYNGHAKLAPENPQGVAEDLSRLLGGVSVAIIDANDISVNILGATADVQRALLQDLLRDNPLGQGHEQTPVALIRPIADLPQAAS